MSKACHCSRQNSDTTPTIWRAQRTTGTPIIAYAPQGQTTIQQPLTAIGQSCSIHEWNGSGPDALHVHYTDDEAWHILEGTQIFRFADGNVDAPAGSTVFVPAGVPHSYFEAHGPTRYLIILTPRLQKLISALHRSPFEQHAVIMRQFQSEIVE